MPTLLEKIDASAAHRLALPPGRQPAQELARYKNFLKVETHRLKILHRAGGGGREICQARAAILDVLLRYILDGVKTHSPEIQKHGLPPLSLVAIGGYGRAELNPQSDIDIMFLHDDSQSRGKTHPGLAALVDGLLYTLWDVKLKVGHSVRSIDDAVKVANTDMQSKTSLIEARLIVGEEKLFQRFQKLLVAKCVDGFEEEYIDARLTDQTSRRAKFGNTPFLQEPNVKNGCGGLRDYQNLIWMSFFKYRTHSLAELQQKEMITEGERKQLEAAYEFLLWVRNELHYEVGRPLDVISRAVQPAVAYSLGYQDRSPSKRLEMFMRDYYRHTRTIDLLTRNVEQRLALVPKKQFMPSFRRLIRSGRQRAQEQVVDGLKMFDGEISAANPRIFKEQPRRLMRMFLHAQQRGLKLHPDLAQLARNHLTLVDNAFLRDQHVRDTFLEILDERGNLAPTLRAMHETGVLGKFLPEFARLTCLVQHEFYHQYTADEHTLVCLEKLDRVWAATEPPYNTYRELYQNIERPFVLHLAMLLHDSGKAHPGERHEDVSSRLALKVARRFGLDGSTTHNLSLVIQHHLTMAQISQRRDLDDTSVIRTFAGQMQSVENLNMLTLHTFADSMGTSDQLWNGFKDSLLWLLYHKTRQELVGGTDFVRAEDKQRELLSEEVRRLMPRSFSDEELRAHFDSLPNRYFQINDAREILDDLALVHRFMHLQLSEKDEALTPIITWHNEPDRGYTTVHACTWDRSGLFSKISGCLTASGLNILAAEIVTRNDGIVLDTFFVTDARTGLLANREEREKFEKIIERVLTGEEIDLSALIARHKGAPSIFQSVAGERIPTAIHLDNDTSETRTIIDLQTEDRIGLLFDISQALAELDMNIHLAKVSTEKGAAIDSFYVTESNGNKILDEDRLKYVQSRLTEAVFPKGSDSAR